MSHRKRQRPRKTEKHRRERATFTKATRLPTLAELVASPDADLDRIDMALLNLVCAVGLPGAEELDIRHLLDTLDEWATLVRLETDRNYYKFIHAPGGFNNSQAYFCILYMVTVLQCKCGVHYNPKWTSVTPDKPSPRDFGRDASDLFIHAIIDGVGGTCGSLPVLYAAVGRRLGYPLRIVKAHQHLFLRWDDPEGKHWFHPDRFNIEATGRGLHCLPDDHHRTWPHEIPIEDIEAGIYLKSLTRREELAEFLATRGYCLSHNGDIGKAIESFIWAVKLAPHNRHFVRSLQELAASRKSAVRGGMFLNAPVENVDHECKGPHWVRMPDGKKVLVQIPRPDRLLPFNRSMDSGHPLVRRMIQLPVGDFAEAELPLHGSGSRMEAHWLRMPRGYYALVHKPLKGLPILSNEHGTGQPILPDQSSTNLGIARPGQSGSSRLMRWEEDRLIAAIQQIEGQQQIRSMPAMDVLALPPGPSRPQMRTTGRQISN